LKWCGVDRGGASNLAGDFTQLTDGVTGGAEGLGGGGGGGGLPKL
jgi:hypothetical protein